MSKKFNKERLTGMFDQMSPSDEQKVRMREVISDHERRLSSRSHSSQRKVWLSTALLSMALLLAVVYLAPIVSQKTVYAVYLINSDLASFKLEDGKGSYEDYGTFASFIDSRPSLRFFIEGENIASIEMTSETEYLSAKDWTKTQHEKYWNIEYYQTFDEETQTSIMDPDKKYERSLTMTFDEDFDQYEKIWYEWRARNLLEWASEDNFSRFIGYGVDPQYLQVDLQELSEEEKLAYASGNDGSPLGHIYLEGYPEELLKDTITIRIIDHRGNITEKVIEVQVSNNEIGQTVVTASVVD